MAGMIRLHAADGHSLNAWRAMPDGMPRGGVVILQEIFGITGHIRRVTGQYAEHGYLAIAPCLFDRVRPGIELDYANIDEGRSIMTGLDLDDAMADIGAAVEAARVAGKVAAVGYCWGGAMADLAACRLDIDAAVSYYGRMTVEWLDERPRCPVLYHFGAEDPLIPPETVEKITGGRPDHPSHVYAGAGHGFNCDERDDYSPENARLALERTLAFLGEHIG